MFFITDTQKQLFFKYYDIHEEEHIAKMNINIFNFVRFIQRLKFKNINDLYLKAHNYANKVRQKPKTIKRRKKNEDEKQYTKME